MIGQNDRLFASRFHCVYWPAFLLALDIPLPRQILTHGHWTMERQKMSKSIGNVVNPFFAISRFGTDTMRYFLASAGSIQDDADYENSYIIKSYKNDLQGDLGNLLSRITRAKQWNVADAVRTSRGNLLQHIADSPLCSSLQDLPKVVAKDMSELNSRAALHKIAAIIRMVCMTLKAHSYTLTFGRQTNISTSQPHGP